MEGTVYDPIFDERETNILRKFVSNPDPASNIYTLLPSLAGLAGALFARYSRAAGGARVTLLKEFIDENGEINEQKLDGLIERILIAFGDESVGEQEKTHLACEKVSNLATKEMEDCRIDVSPIEQSSRYVVYDQRDRNGKFRYLRPKEVEGAGLLDQYEEAMDFIFQTYVNLIPYLAAFYMDLKPESEAEYAVIPDDSKKYRLAELTDPVFIKAWKITYKMDIKTKTCDTLRGLLPAATLTNVGFAGGGRGFQNMLTKLMSHPLQEMRQLGHDAKQALSVVIPRYVQRAAPNQYLIHVRYEMQELAGLLDQEIRKYHVLGEDKHVQLFFCGEWNWEAFAVAHILYPYTSFPMSKIYAWAQNSSCPRRKIIQTYCQNRDIRGNRRNKPGRAFEFGYPITLDLIGDFGMYRDLQRHRMLTQQHQRLTPYLGEPEIPQDVIAAGCEKEYKECIVRSRQLYDLLLTHCGPDVAQYAVLYLFNIRWYKGMNFREAFHLMELRTIPQGHPSYRKLVQEMHRELSKRDSLIAPLMEFVDYEDYAWNRADSEAAQRRKEAKLDS
ncbi:MAG: FAD-dependent thymidylate synthase [Patescibacteria group bacterium]